jgi:hypothetical protein
MPRKKPVFKEPFLHLFMKAEGEVLLTVTAAKPAALTAREFDALIKLNPNVRKTAVATTLIEIARSLLVPRSDVYMLLLQATEMLVLDELPMQDFTVPDDFPF